MTNNIHSWVSEANANIKAYIRQTPLEYSYYLSELCQAKVYLKLENQQVTGSFKARGALNMILNLSDKQREAGVITASTGNHAAAVGYALSITRSKGDIFMPETVAELKIENLKQYPNVKVTLFGNDSIESEMEAINQAELQRKVYVSPYNNEKIIGGQGTIGVEILNQLPEVNNILVPVGGGGLISGIAGYTKKEKDDIEIIGCQPSNSAVMYHSIQAGKILEMDSSTTISEGTAGGIELDSITFPICQKFVDDYHLLAEEEIMQALGILLKHHQIMAEGAAGLAVAGLIKNKEHYKDKHVVLIICGNKMSLALMGEAIATQD